MSIITLCIAGKNNIAVEMAKYLLAYKKNVRIVACINKNDKGLNTFQKSFKLFCQLNDIRILKLEELYNIKDLIFLSLEFDQIIKTNLFNSTYLYNIHFSLLPKYKGMYTSALPILFGENETGVTLHKIDNGIDTGDIIAQKVIGIDNFLTAEELYSNYISEGIELIIKNIDNILLNKIILSPQSSFNSSYYSKNTIDYNKLILDFNKSAFQVLRQINAFSFSYYQLPVFNGNTIYSCKILETKSKVKYGTKLNEDYFSMSVSTIDFDILLKKDLRLNLFDIAIKGDIESLKGFIDYGYDIYQRSKEGWDIAIIAAYNDEIDFLEYLINTLKWDVNTYNNNGTTLCMYIMTRASKTNNIDYLIYFLENYKPNLQIKDFFGKSILCYAEEYDNLNVIEIIKKYS